MKGTYFRAGVVAILGAGLTGFATAQTPPAFEVASVKVASGAGGGKGGPQPGIEASPGGLNMSNVNLATCLRWAYGVKEYQISGPGWMGTEIYTINAKSAGSVSTDELKRMLQTLLAEKFNLALHRETKDLPAYALVTAKGGPKLETGQADAKAALTFDGGTLVFKDTSMEELADRLSVKPFGMDRPVLDKTALKGRYNFRVKFAESIADLKMSLGREQEPSTYAEALAQLGLKLDPHKGPLEVLVVDKANKLPVAN